MREIALQRKNHDVASFEGIAQGGCIGSVGTEPLRLMQDIHPAGKEKRQLFGELPGSIGGTIINKKNIKRPLVQEMTDKGCQPLSFIIYWDNDQWVVSMGGRGLRVSAFWLVDPGYSGRADCKHCHVPGTVLPLVFFPAVAPPSPGGLPNFMSLIRGDSLHNTRDVV